MTSEWNRVTRAAPCPVCKKADWCGVSADGAAACCMRVQSERQAKNGGWIHRVGLLPPVPRRPSPRPLEHKLEPSIDAPGIWQSYRKDPAVTTTGDAALALGLPPWTVWELGAGIDPHGNLAFPMHDGHLDVIGIRLRSADGKKWAVKGSRAGVFVPWRYRPSDWNNNGHVVVVEGPTDASAVLALNMIPIGRPSCLGGEQTLLEAARALGATSLTIVADNDGPGVMGARRLCTTLDGSGIRWRLVTAGGHKDMRQWWQAGLTRPMVELQWAQAQWR
jgi:hypothetical protein